MIFSAYSQTQTSPFEKFGSVRQSDLQKTDYSIDSNANAVILCSIGKTTIAGNTSGGFTLKTEVHQVVHIFTENGYDVANMEIPLYKSGSTVETVTNFKCFTYNIVDGKMEKAKVKSSVMIKEVVDEIPKSVKVNLEGSRC